MATHERDVKIRLLLAAKKLFARQGFEGTTIREISEEAGANPALVSYHFQGKDRMFEAIFEQFYPFQLVEVNVKADLEPVEGIKLIIRELVLFRARDPAMIRLIQNEVAHESKRRDLIRTYLFPIWGKLRSLLEAGRQQGLFHYRSLDSAFLYLWGGILYHREFSFFDPILSEMPPTAEALSEDLIDFVLGALHYEAEPSQKLTPDLA